MVARENARYRPGAGDQGYVARVPVFALWSAPRARPTAFFRSMLERKAVFFKETTEPRVLDLVLADHRFLRETRFALLIRRLEEIAASLHAMQSDIGIATIGLEVRESA